jgi:hypothetical protein
MIQFAEVFPAEQIVASLMRQLSWIHFTLLIPLKELLQREFSPKCAGLNAGAGLLARGASGFNQGVRVVDRGGTIVTEGN